MSTSCLECGKAFRNLARLEAHQRKMHQEDAVYTCFECNETFVTSEYLLEHFVMHKPKTDCHTCVECDLEFDYYFLYAQHKHSKHNKV
jgi:hypothetical protein